MEYTNENKNYVAKLRRINRNIPNDEIIANVLSKLKKDKEKVIDDLIIRNFDGIAEFELV